MTLSTDETTALRIPESMVLEHEELHEELFAATQEPGEVGAAAQLVADRLHEHFEKEEEFALPPLGLLAGLAAGKMGPDVAKVLELTDRLKADLPEMLQEHAGIVAALETLTAAAQKAGLPRYVHFAENLRLHAQTEEQVSYPTAILIGEYIKLKLNK